MTKKPQKTSQKQLLQDIQRNPPAAPKLGMGSVKPHVEILCIFLTADEAEMDKMPAGLTKKKKTLQTIL